MKRVALLVWLFLHCPQRIDQSLLKNIDEVVFSLPAEITRGTISFRLAKYKTAGSIGNQIVTLDDQTYDPQQVITYTTVGAQVYYYKIKETPEGYTIYQPRFVVSGGANEQDIRRRRNVIIISILGDFIEEVGAIPENNKNAFCIKEQAANGFPQCSSSVFYTGSRSDGEDFSSRGYEVYNFGDPNADSSEGRKFNTVVEFIDNNGTVFTSIFPYSKDLDQKGNHTNFRLKIAQFPKDPPSEEGYLGTDDESIKNIATYPPLENPPSLEPSADGTDNYSNNCTGFYTDPSAAGTFDSNNYLFAKGYCKDLWTLLNDPTYIVSNGVQSAERNDTNTHCSQKSSSGKKDFVCMHFLQEAGREHKAEGTDGDPLYEMVILGLEFSVERYPKDRYFESLEDVSPVSQ